MQRHILTAFALLALPFSAACQTPMHFTCGKAPGATLLSADTRYAPGSVFGFDLVASPTAFTAGACASDSPFFFSVAVPDGNYQVTLILGSGSASTTTVRAESRRLFIDRLKTPANASHTVVFNVNVRSEFIAGAPATPDGKAARVHLKPREIGALDWDNKLTLEFNGIHPGFHSITIRPIANVPTVYLAGDSTVVDQDKEPWAAWGQMLPVFFGPGVVIANHAESGETIRSFSSERRFDKILSTLHPGDFLLIQFAHNDQKEGTPEATGYKANLVRYIEAAHAHGATPILVTSMNRRDFSPDGKIKDTFAGFPQAMREVAVEQKVALIDLNALSKTLFEAMGPTGTLKAFVHFPANTFPDQPEELKDNTHFTAYGAYELARALVQNLRDQNLPLAQYLRKNIPAFNPANPEDPTALAFPASPLVSTEKPYGR